MIFFKAQPGLADGADDAGVEVGEAVDEVERGGGGVAGGVKRGVEEQAVDGEVAAADVVSALVV